MSEAADLLQTAGIAYQATINGGYHEVFVRFVNTDVFNFWGHRHITNRDVWDWIDEHVEPRGWYTAEKPGYPQGSFFCFEDLSDALLFKLTWGGCDVT